jgi:hypothetical protein
MHHSSGSRQYARIGAALALGIAVSLAGATAQAQPAPSEPKPAAGKPAKPAADKPAGAKPADKAAAEAQGPDKKTRDAARKAYNDAKKAFDKGDYAAAMSGFRKADDTLPSPHAKYWYAAALDKSDAADANLEAKIAAYDKFLADPEASRVGDSQLAEARERQLALVNKTLGTVTITTVPPNAQVTVDGKAQTGQSPLTLQLAPGVHKLSVAAEGFVAKEVEVTVEKGGKLTQAVELTAEPKPEPAAAPPPAPAAPAETAKKRSSKVPAYVTLGLAGAGAVVGTVFGVMALSKKGDFDDEPTTKNADDTERNALVADMAFGVALTLGVTGIVLLTSKDDSETAKLERLEKLPKRTTVSVAPYFTGNGGGAAARLTF